MKKEFKEYLTFFAVILLTLVSFAAFFAVLYYAASVVTMPLPFLVIGLDVLGLCVLEAAIITVYILLLRLMVDR